MVSGDAFAYSPSRSFPFILLGPADESTWNVTPPSPKTDWLLSTAFPWIHLSLNFSLLMLKMAVDFGVWCKAIYCVCTAWNAHRTCLFQWLRVRYAAKRDAITATAASASASALTGVCEWAGWGITEKVKLNEGTNNPFSSRERESVIALNDGVMKHFKIDLLTFLLSPLSCCAFIFTFSFAVVVTIAASAIILVVVVSLFCCRCFPVFSVVFSFTLYIQSWRRLQPTTFSIFGFLDTFWNMIIFIALNLKRHNSLRSFFFLLFSCALCQCKWCIQRASHDCVYEWGIMCVSRIFAYIKQTCVGRRRQLRRRRQCSVHFNFDCTVSQSESGVLEKGGRKVNRCRFCRIDFNKLHPSDTHSHTAK